MDHSQEDCLVVIILSHGECIQFHEIGQTILSHDRISYIHAKDKIYALQSVFNRFTNQNCETLIDKPRIFLIQACQGIETDEGFELKPNKFQKTAETDGIGSIGVEKLEMVPVLPQKDFLIVYSSVPGFYAFRNTEHGSWFIEALCSKLNERKQNCDLMGVLTNVNLMVASEYEYQSDNPKFDKKKADSMYCVIFDKKTVFI